ANRISLFMDVILRWGARQLRASEAGGCDPAHIAAQNRSKDGLKKQWPGRVRGACPPPPTGREAPGPTKSVRSAAAVGDRRRRSVMALGDTKQPNAAS